MFTKLFKIAFAIVLVFSQFAVCMASNIGQIIVDKQTALLGERVTITYVFNYMYQKTTIPFPEKEAFKDLTLIAINETVYKTNQISKQYIVTRFDSGQINIPLIDTETFEINTAPVVIFNYLPISLIPDTVLPKYPAQKATSLKSTKNNLKKYALLIISGLLLIILSNFMYQRSKRKKDLRKNNLTIFDALKKLKVGKSQNETAEMYTNLRQIIIASIHNKTTQSIGHYSQKELLLFLENDQVLNNKATIKEIIEISDPTLYGKFFPNEKVQQNHISITEQFVTKNSIND